MTFEYAAALLATGRWLDAGWHLIFILASNPDDPQLLDWAQALYGPAIGEARRIPRLKLQPIGGRVSCSPAGRRLNTTKPVERRTFRGRGRLADVCLILAKDRKEIRRVAVVWGGEGCFEQIEPWPRWRFRTAALGRGPRRQDEL